ncbi:MULTISPECIES: hypothetical protein [unclassified Phaeobacter]
MLRRIFAAIAFLTAFISAASAQQNLLNGDVFRGFEMSEQGSDIVVEGYGRAIPWLQERPLHPYMLENGNLLDLVPRQPDFQCETCVYCNAICVPPELQDLPGTDINRWLFEDAAKDGDKPKPPKKTCTKHKICVKGGKGKPEICYEYEVCTENADQFGAPLVFSPMTIVE